MTPNAQIKIQEKAFSIWKSEGCPDEKDLDHWLRAEAEITNENKKAKPDKQKQRG